MADPTTMTPQPFSLLDGRDLEHAVDRVIKHHVSELEKHNGG